MMTQSAAEVLKIFFIGIPLELFSRKMKKSTSGGASLKAKYSSLRSFAISCH